MKKKIIITEEEKLEIMSMYGIISEQTSLYRLERLLTKQGASNIERQLGRDVAEDLEILFKNAFDDSTGMLSRNLERNTAGELFIKSSSGTKINLSDFENILKYVEQNPTKIDLLPSNLADGTEFRSVIKNIIDKRKQSIAGLGGGTGSVSNTLDSEGEKLLKKFSTSTGISAEEEAYLRNFTVEIDKLGSVSVDQAFNYFEKQLSDKAQRNINRLKISQAEKDTVREIQQKNLETATGIVSKYATKKNFKSAIKFFLYAGLVCTGVNIGFSAASYFGVEPSDANIYLKALDGICNPIKYLSKVKGQSGGGQSGGGESGGGASGGGASGGGASGGGASGGGASGGGASGGGQSGGGASGGGASGNDVRPGTSYKPKPI